MVVANLMHLQGSLFKRRRTPASAACIEIDPGPEYASAGNDSGYPEHGGDGKGCRTSEICYYRSIQPAASDYVSVLPEVF